MIGIRAGVQRPACVAPVKVPALFHRPTIFRMSL